MKKLFQNQNYKTIFFIWLGWVFIMVGYQIYVLARMDIARPDYALNWTPNETTKGSQNGKAYLNEPFLNQHVSWDSEYYLAIAVGGYEDPGISRIGTFINEMNASPGRNYWPFVIPQGQAGTRVGISKSYAFFPFYPFVMRLVSAPKSASKIRRLITPHVREVSCSSPFAPTFSTP